MSSSCHDDAGSGSPASPAARWAFLGIISAGLFLIAIDNSVLYTALPVLRVELGASELQNLWILNAYPLVMSGLLLGTGTLGDKLGRYFPYFGARGAMLLELGRIEEAHAAFDRAISLATTAAEAAHIRGRLYRLMARKVSMESAVPGK